MDLDGRSQADLLNLYQFPPGRVVFSADQVAERAAAQELPRVVVAANRAGEVAREQLQLDLRWIAGRGESRAVHTARALELDGLLNRAVGGLAKAASSPLDIFGAESEQGQRATRFLSTVMPAGPGEVIKLSFEEQHTAVAQMVALATGELAEDTEALGLTEAIARLARPNDEFGAEVRGRAPSQAPTFDQVSAARARTREALAALVMTICGELAGSSTEIVEQRVALLQPILEQNAAIQHSHRRRRIATDIDPETGREQAPEPAAPIDVIEPTPAPQPEPEPAI